MKKRLLKSEQDFQSWLNSLVTEVCEGRASTFGSIQDIEDYFAVDFLSEAGQLFEDFENARTDDDTDDWEVAIPIRYQVRNDGHSEPMVPTAYPCLAVSCMERDFDRTGDVSIRILEYVYLTDFADA